MSLINCPECANQISDKASACPSCGFPIKQDSKVVVHGYTQQFMINPKVKVFWNDEPVGVVTKGHRLELDVHTNGTIRFTSGFHSAVIPISSGSVTNVKLSWDRITGKLIPQIVDVVTPSA